MDDLRDLIRILEEHPEWRAELRRVLLSNELLRCYARRDRSGMGYR